MDKTEQAIEFQRSIEPQALRNRYGNSVGDDFSSIIAIGCLNNEGIAVALNKLDDMSDEQRINFLDVLRNKVYEQLADTILRRI